jgi:hypothetical protein
VVVRQAAFERAQQVGMETVRITAVTQDGGVTPSAAVGVSLWDAAALSVEEADRVVVSRAELLQTLIDLGMRRAVG